MTPQANRCMLTHHGSGPGQDLAIVAPLRSEKVVLAVILPKRGAFTAPVQLTVVAQGESAEQIGRVTFDATGGGLGTLLMADWPANSLLPRIARADRLAFFTPDQRILRSVTLAGAPAALAALNRCRDVAVTPPLAPVGGSERHVIDAGWIPQLIAMVAAFDA